MTCSEIKIRSKGQPLSSDLIAPPSHVDDGEAGRRLNFDNKDFFPAFGPR